MLEIFLKTGMLIKKSNMQKTHIANSDKPVVFYYLHVVLAMGMILIC